MGCFSNHVKIAPFESGTSPIGRSYIPRCYAVFMGPAILAIVVAFCVQKPPSDNAICGDVPNNHFVYATLSELKSGGLLPELDPDSLISATHPLTRAKIGRYIVEATINLQRFIDEHREMNSVGGTARYSDTVSTLTGNQISYLIGLTSRIRRVAKAVSPNLPPFVRWPDLDHSLDAEAKLIDGLLAGD